MGLGLEPAKPSLRALEHNVAQASGTWWPRQTVS